MGIFQDSMAVSLAVGVLVGLVMAAPFWWGLGKTEIGPTLQRLVTVLDFAIVCVGITYILHSGLLT